MGTCGSWGLRSLGGVLAVGMGLVGSGWSMAEDGPDHEVLDELCRSLVVDIAVEEQVFRAIVLNIYLSALEDFTSCAQIVWKCDRPCASKGPSSSLGLLILV